MKEDLGLTYGLEIFHCYVYGLPTITVVTAPKCPKYDHIRSELSVANGLLLRDDRIVIQHSLRLEVLQKLHEGQLGIESFKRRSRDTVYWHGISKDIEDMIGKCETCKKHQSKQTRKPMRIPDLPTEPWKKVGTDLFHCNGKNCY